MALGEVFTPERAAQFQQWSEDHRAGMNEMFAARDVPMYTIFRGIIPFWFAMVICIVLLLIFPQIVTYLPNTMGG